MALTKATYSMILGAAINVRDYGAVGDGSANDTAAIQAAFTAAIAAGNNIYYPPGTYKQGPVTITGANNFAILGQNAKINAFGDMSGASDDTTRTAVFNFAGTCSNVSFIGLIINGDAVLANKQRGIGYVYASPPTRSDIVDDGCEFTNLLICAVLPGVNRARLTNNTVASTLGNASGQGLGFVTELAGVTQPKDVIITDNNFFQTTRHAIYTNFVLGAVVANNTFREHAPAFAGGASTGKFACVISRCTSVGVTGNVFIDCNDAALGLDQDATYAVSDVSVCGNVFKNTNGVSFFAGRTSAAGSCFNVTVTGNTFAPSASYNDADISVTDIKQFKFANNTVDANRSYPLTKVVLKISEYDAAYFEDVDISNNTAIISSSGNAFFVEISAALSASSGGKILLNTNRVTGSTREYLYAPSGVCTNSKIETDWTYVADITAAGTPSIAGYNSFNVSLAAPGSITSFANGYDQKRITLAFTNGNATLTNAMYLASATNFVGTTSDYMQLLYQTSVSNWYEQSRSVN
jgi:hypothetical protein